MHVAMGLTTLTELDSGGVRSQSFDRAAMIVTV